MTTHAIVIAKRTSWQRFVEEARDPHVLELLRNSDPTVARMRSAHESHMATVDEVDAALSRHGISAHHIEPRSGPFATTGVDLVVTVGGDGTLLGASHHVGNIPILAVNSAPGNSIGFFCGTEAGRVDDTVRRFSAGDLGSLRLARMAVFKNGAELSRHVLNDALVCSASPAATSRYILELAGLVEEQRSSGFWIGPAAGSTAAQRSAGGAVLPLDSEDIQLVIREPYTPIGKQLRVARHVLHPGETLLVRSKMVDGMIFIDGPAECQEVTLGDVLEFRKSDEPLTLLGLDRTRNVEA